jgi:hypothetical protein
MAYYFNKKAGLGVSLILLLLIVLPLAHGASSAYTPTNDVLVVHTATNTYSVYTSASSAGTANGLALLSAASNIVSGDNIYLNAETYNIVGNYVNLGGPCICHGASASGVALYGAGKSATVIIGNNLANGVGKGGVVIAGPNSITSDLSIYDTGASGYPWGEPVSYNGIVGNAILRNSLTNGKVDSVYIIEATAFAIVQNGNFLMENDTIQSGWITTGGANDGTVPSGNALFNPVFTYIDSYINASRAMTPGGSGSLVANIVVVNSVIVGNVAAINDGGTAGDIMMLYGTSATTPTNATGHDIAVAGTAYINSTTTYNSMKTVGIISNTLTTYGLYTYPHSPIARPIVLSSNSFAATVAEVGGSETLSTTWNGMDSPYVANYLVYNTVGLCTSQPFTGLSGSSNSFTYSTTACGAGAMTANLIITDNAVALVTNTVSFMVNNAPTTPSTPAASNSVADASQYETFSTSFTGSSSPYTYNWIISNAVTGTVVYSSSSSNSLTTNTFTLQIPSYFASNSPLKANVVVTDIDTLTVNSIYSANFVANPTPTLATLTASNSVLDRGQYVTYNVILNGGTGPFTINLINTAGSGTVVNTIIWATNTPISNVITFGSNIPATPSQTFNVVATDTGTVTTPFVFNSVSNTVAVNPAPTLATLTPSSAVLDRGQYVTYNVLLNGGTGPFTVNLVNGGFVVNTIVWSTSTPISNIITFGANIPVTPSQTFNVIATDTGTVVTPFMFNSVSNTVTVNPSLSSGALTESNTVIYAGQSSTLTAIASNQPDVLVQYSNGVLVGYNASANTDQARGVALLTAFKSSNMASGESVYLKAETYNIISNGINMSGATGTLTNTNLYGAGKYKSLIISDSNGVSPGNTVILPGTNSVTADLGIECYNENQYCFPWGTIASGYTILNATMRNVYIIGTTDGIFVQTLLSNNRPFSANVYNLTVNTQWDTVAFADTNAISNYINIFDSSFNAVANPALTGGGAIARGLVVQGKTTVVNSSVTASGGSSQNQGIVLSASSSVANVFGGSVTSSGAAAVDLYASPGTINVNSTVKYSTTQGTVNTIALGTSPYGAYTYQKYPTTPPLSFGGTQTYQINWFASGSCTGPSIGSGSSISVSPGSTTSYSYNVVDSATTNSVSCSASNTVTVSSAPTTTVPQSGGGSPSTGGLPPSSSTVTTTTTTITTTTPTTIIPLLVNSSYNITSMPTDVTIDKSGTLTLSSQSPIKVFLRITNVTSIVPEILPSNMIISAFNVVAVNAENMTLNQTVTLTMMLRYSCSIQSTTIAPYKLLGNGKWSPITPFTTDSSACTVTFTIPPDPIVALFESIKPISTTSASTTMPTTTVATTTAPQSGQPKGFGYALVLVVVVVVIIAAVAYYLLRRRKH